MPLRGLLRPPKDALPWSVWPWQPETQVPRFQKAHLQRLLRHSLLIHFLKMSLLAQTVAAVLGEGKSTWREGRCTGRQRPSCAHWRTASGRADRFSHGSLAPCPSQTSARHPACLVHDCTTALQAAENGSPATSGAERACTDVSAAAGTAPERRSGCFRTLVRACSRRPSRSSSFSKPFHLAAFRYSSSCTAGICPWQCALAQTSPSSHWAKGLRSVWQWSSCRSGATQAVS